MQSSYPSPLSGYLELEYKYPAAIRPFLLFFISSSQTQQPSTNNQIKPTICLTPNISTPSTNKSINMGPSAISRQRKDLTSFGAGCVVQKKDLTSFGAGCVVQKKDLTSFGAGCMVM
ncbi:hypothetical protein V502_07305 [Pseudogymnoascus sp. VKM F-4520 (FW-2644)]|nr:hypothetical protein V502_07305 [Pseudogymnoascus sp. VKM F-4520 (FW-2644)]